VIVTTALFGDEKDKLQADAAVERVGQPSADGGSDAFLVQVACKLRSPTPPYYSPPSQNNTLACPQLCINENQRINYCNHRVFVFSIPVSPFIRATQRITSPFMRSAAHLLTIHPRSTAHLPAGRKRH
jgi:hypothetical protein